MKNTFILLFLILGFYFIFSSKGFALPIDWHGKFAVDTILNQRASFLVLDKNTASISNNGSQEATLGGANKNKQNLSVQTYIFTLSPEILVNDAVSIYSELTPGYARGGRLGDNSAQTQANLNGANTNSASLIAQNFSGQSARLNVNQLYIKFFSDSATYIIGKFTDNFGLGAIVNSGENAWDRFSSIREGIAINAQIGNFKLAPFWSHNVSNDVNNVSSINEYGTSLIYNNMDTNLKLGILFSKKIASSENNFLYFDGSKMGETNTTLVDLFFKKTFNKLEIAIEAPIFSGTLGQVGQNGTNYSASALIFESNYKLNNKWSFGIDAGQVSGEDGDKSKFKALSLNPNFQIANLLFRYNRQALEKSNYNLFDSYVKNVLYLKLKSQLKKNNWLWNFNLIYAKADQVAKQGASFAFNHYKNKYFVPQLTQDSNLGLEFDIDFNYTYNDELSFTGSAGILNPGDYFTFTNDVNIVNTAKMVLSISMGAMVTF